MGILKIKNHVQDKEQYLSNLVRYIIEGEAPSGLYGSPNTEYRSAEIAIKQINQVKNFFGKEEFNCMVHIIISFDISEVMEFITAIKYTNKICEYFSARYQLVWAVHETPHDDPRSNSSQWHTHIAINPVSYIDGHMLNLNYSAQYAFLEYIKEVTETQDKYWLIEHI
ncbi:MAG: relaxase/mobilization nuclease domain-containing protein [Oscillospiraceae bacterium]|nr:relaxase/mobilization nuclease domain-containing protein [Oscillospiraceae bacterium]